MSVCGAGRGGGVRVIPVVDLLQGQVVHARQGQRKRYRPLKSVLSNESTPQAVARALRDRINASAVYVADLDAIQFGEPAWDAIDQIGDFIPEIWLDIGLRHERDSQQLIRHAHEKPFQVRPIVALETLGGPGVLQRMLANNGPDACPGGGAWIFSLDLRDGKPILDRSAWDTDDPLQLVERAVQCGMETILVLDLAQVGAGQGVATTDLCCKIMRQYPGMHVITGGGIRGHDDLRRLADTGCSAALVGSALYSGVLLEHGGWQDPWIEMKGPTI